MAHAQRPDFVFLQKGQVRLNRRGRQFSRLLAAEVCAKFLGSVKSAGYPLHSPVSPSLPLPASPCAITFQLDSMAFKATLGLLAYGEHTDMHNRNVGTIENIYIYIHRVTQKKGTFEKPNKN